MLMPSDQELKAQRPELVKLKARLSQLLDGSLLGNFADGVKLLENHLLEGLAEQGNQLPVMFSITDENLKQYSDLVVQIAAETKTYKEEQPLDLFRLSACDTAGAEGIIMISVGTGISPAAGVIGFSSSVWSYC
jgi:hypothetical protein